MCTILKIGPDITATTVLTGNIFTFTLLFCIWEVGGGKKNAIAFYKKKYKNKPSWGERGSIYPLRPLSPQNLSTIGEPLLGEKNHGRRKKETKALSIVATTFCLLLPLAAHKLHSDNKLNIF